MTGRLALVGVCMFSLSFLACSDNKTAGSAPPVDEPVPCGDGVRSGEEQCDQTDLAGQSCTSLGYDGGELGCTDTCLFGFGSCTGDGPQCGDDIAEGLEPCDGTDLNDATCNTVGYTGGILACQNCELDTSGCTGDAPVCGDGNAEGLEQCDGADLNQLDCEDLGFNGGLLACDATCRLNTGGCEGVQQFCGDGQALGLEDCDGNDFNGIGCTNLGYDSGDIACDNSCNFDTQACVGTPALCGDNVVNGLEKCDGEDLGGTDCMDLDYVGGTLACDSSCTFDPTGCTLPQCGNDIIEPGEQCDGTALDTDNCTELGLGTGTLTCRSDCTYDTSDCVNPICGDGSVNQDTELCDLQDFAGESCRTLSFRGGQLLCTDSCNYDTTFCWGTDAVCGDDERALSEPCEGDDLGGTQCLDLGYDGGTLTCTDNCTFDLTECTGDGPTCGDNLAEGEEMCDGDDLRLATCEAFGFTGGTLACNPQCTLSFLNCTHEPQCGNDIAERNEMCDGVDLRGATCASLDAGTGDLACSDTCDAFDYTGCTLQPVCGNDVVEGVEVCDGSDLREMTNCLMFGYTDDVQVSCLPTCGEFDLSMCTGSPIRCGNGRAQGVEQCDGDDLRSRTCEDLGYADGDLACNDNCSYDVDACTQ